MPTHSKFFALALIALAALILYLDWTGERPGGPLLSDLRTLPIESQGHPGGAGNLVAIETRLLPADYQDAERLRLRFATYLDQARDAGLLNAHTVVALPEHVGTGLFATDEKPEVQQARTLRDAMQWMALSNPWDYLRALLDHQGSDRRTEAVLKIKARQMARDYQDVFGDLARRYGVTLVAGSIVLPEPRLEDGRLLAGSGPLRQVSVTFAPDGAPLAPLQYKLNLSRYERRYSEAPTEAANAPIQTPAGRLAVLIGCDGYRGMTANNAQLAVIIGAGQTLPPPCPPRDPSASGLPTLSVSTLGLPWNLVGSPRRPTRHLHSEPVRITNLWLPPQ